MEAVDFRKPKNTWHITITDELEIDLKLPTKDFLNDVICIGERVKSMDEDEQCEEIYNIAATAMSNNVQGIEVTPYYLKTSMDIGEIIDFISLYTEFISEVVSEKNSRSRSTLNRAMKRAKNTSQTASNNT